MSFQVNGVTARELCHYFFAPEFRMEWETTVEQATVLEKIAPDTLIFLQVKSLSSCNFWGLCI
jgi:hypothetical protein